MSFAKCSLLLALPNVRVQARWASADGFCPLRDRTPTAACNPLLDRAT